MANEKRLIDAEQAKRATYEEVFWTESEQAVVRNFLAKLPKVDAVEVCRCKDCKHYKPQNQGVHRNCTTPYCMRVVAVKVSQDDFCSYGEKREV